MFVHKPLETQSVLFSTPSNITDLSTDIWPQLQLSGAPYHVDFNDIHSVVSCCSVAT